MVSYKYNIYKSKNLKHIDNMLSECCFVWNHALALQRRYYGIYKRYIPYTKISSHFTKRFRRNLLHSQTRQEILQRLDEAYNRFFKKISKRPPKFKNKEMFSSFVFKQGGFVLNGNTFTINKIKRTFKFSFSRKYEGKVKQIRVKRESNYRYSLYIVTDHSLANTRRKTHNGASVGIDFGLKTYMTLSDRKEIQSPLFFKKHEKNVKRANRKFSMAKKGSNNRKRRLFELCQVHRKIKDQRDDFQWKLAHDLCRQFDYIFLETLNIDGMRRIWGKKINDLSHSEFVSKLEYVASKYGVIVHHIDKWFPSSKTCECGYVNKSLSLKDRNWTCPECGSKNKRDLLAAKNILRRGIYELESGSKTSLEASHVCI